MDNAECIGTTPSGTPLYTWIDGDLCYEQYWNRCSNNIQEHCYVIRFVDDYANEQ